MERWRVQRSLAARDGTEFTYYVDGSDAAPPMVLCPGLGGGIDVWRPFLPRFRERFRLLTWDYRGLYRSGAASHPERYAPAHHADDLVALLEHEKVEAPIIVGWSMGVQVALELHRAHPSRASGLVAIHGAAGRPLDTAFDSDWPGRVAPAALGLLRLLGDRLRPIGPTFVASPGVVETFTWLGQSLGVMAPELDRRHFRRVASAWTQLDLGTYADIFEQLGDHDASDLLDSIQTPALIIAGDADRFTPMRLSESMSAVMPNAELAIVRGATHFGLLEFPNDILDLVEGFTRDRLGLV